MNYPAELVFGAACAAQRINADYVKGIKWPDVAAPDAKPSNRRLMTKLLAVDTSDTGDYISEDDMAQGRDIRKYFQALTFKILQGKVLSDFDSNALAICNRDELSTNYELAVACSFPASYLRGKARDTVENRVKFAAGGFIGQVGDKISIQVEVLRTFYSQQWNTHYVTAITDEDQALFFSFKEGLDPGIYTIVGTVKSHRDNQTQLNRVKIK